MRAETEEIRARQRIGAGWPLVGSILIALLAVSTLGALHSAEHDVPQHGASSCAACIAVASHGLVAAAEPLPRAELNDERPVPSPDEDSESFGRITRLSARAPPAFLG
ncbi:MAG: hypothetical protein FJ144_24450 [Deltaproteobacteria bacterium]|nr:hypothetical protein [Deltaproteobacteria bacterium]